MEQDGQNIILLIGVYVLAFFVIYSVATWLIKFVMRKLAKNDEQTHIYITAEEYDKEIKALKERIEKLESELSNKSDKPVQENLSTPSERFDSPDNAPCLSTINSPLYSNRRDFLSETEKGLLTQYLPPPSPDGVFHETFPQPRVGKTVYQMTTVDGNNGTFIFYDNRDALATAMISISQIVKTVCRVENNKNAPRNIVNVKEGQVVREGNSWRVVEKATVRFE
ncbi:hypothetical protein [Prevotella koreensis]|uniref:hypothetical protein n=1 Tax=Prevotella koreensis TaxID=2490854 RepID=UPI0028F004AE|nr:hypothetical protein [Prevotella koreensis]